MVAVTLLRGLKVSVSTLDAFLAANGVDETYGAPPFTEDHPDKDAISVLLHTKLGLDADPQRLARVVIPQRRDMNRSAVAYVAYAWVMVFAHRQIQLDTDLPVEAPATFEALCKEILGFRDDSAESVADEGSVGLFLVTTDEGSYVPEVLRKRREIPQYCDQCSESFDTWDAWERRQGHRKQVHGSTEGEAPLPEA